MGDNNNRTTWVEEALTTVHMGSTSKVGALRVGPLSRFPVFLLPLLELAGPSAFLLSFWAFKGALHIVTRDPAWRAPSPHTARVLSEFSGLEAQSPPCARGRLVLSSASLGPSCPLSRPSPSYMECSFRNCILFTSFRPRTVDPASYNCTLVTAKFPGAEVGAGDVWEGGPEPCLTGAAGGLQIRAFWEW